jgi:hypothetical protein
MAAFYFRSWSAVGFSFYENGGALIDILRLGNVTTNDKGFLIEVMRFSLYEIARSTDAYSSTSRI